MSQERLRFVICGLSITSSWGNGHATTYRGLIRELVSRGHDVLFLERDMPWYAESRDLAHPSYCRTELYQGIEELKDRFSTDIKQADVVIIGSYVPEGVSVGRWALSAARGVTAFYDIDTPVTLAKLARDEFEYIHPALIPDYHLYLSFTGGPTLRTLEQYWRSPMARVLYCSADPDLYFPERMPLQYDLGYLGTYGADRQPTLEELLVEPARAWAPGRFAVAGPLYPAQIPWPKNVARIEHLGPAEHRRFYNSQRFTLNITRADMIRAGHSPSVRIFEAAACGTPIISDYWDGLESLFAIGKELLVAGTATQALSMLRDIREEDRLRIGRRARRRVLAHHTAARRAEELESYVWEAQEARPRMIHAANGSPHHSISAHDRISANARARKRFAGRGRDSVRCEAS